MFKFLKEKIAGWAKKISKDKSEPEKTESKPKSIKIKEEKTQKEKLKKFEHAEETEEKQGFFSKLKSKISKTTISDEEFDSYSEELQNLLLENNVAYEVAEKIILELRKRIIGKEILKKEIESEIRDGLRDTIEELLIEPFDIVSRITEKNLANKNEPYVILFVGINGTGKTTTIAKIAHYLKGKNISSVIAAADTFRAASIEQLKKHGEKLGVKIISQQYGADPAAVGFDAISYAKKNHINCVLIDTAGRMHTAKNLMKEIEKIANVCKPDLKLFIGESITGNDSVEQAKSFNFAIGIQGIILAKADVDEKGGTALSVGYAIKRPILFLGTGQEYDKLEPFNKKKFSEKLGL
ncbi:MAG: signal recognition particle-docking protein FtsY [Candidatus Pacearchaeota archaeon]|nr:signal recognition particle-docking protein FtsY [Candidatus Pacearchaeota archaeon]